MLAAHRGDAARSPGDARRPGVVSDGRGAHPAGAAERAQDGSALDARVPFTRGRTAVLADSEPTALELGERAEPECLDPERTNPERANLEHADSERVDSGRDSSETTSSEREPGTSASESSEPGPAAGCGGQETATSEPEPAKPEPEGDAAASGAQNGAVHGSPQDRAATPDAPAPTPESAHDAEDFLYAPTLYLIVTDSGKPVYYSVGREREISRYAAVVQAIAACFARGEELQSFRAPRTLFVVQNARPLILVAVDKCGRSEAQLRASLELLQAQILSVLTKKQLQRQLDAKPNLDLRPLLGGTAVFLDALAAEFARARAWTWLGALESLTLRRSVRAALNRALLACRGDSSLLYGFVACDGRFCGVVRPRQHSLHPPDLHLVFNMLFNTAVFVEGEHWVPICFPKFNPNGFLYAYIQRVSPTTYIALVSPNRTGFYELQAAGARLVAQLEPQLVAQITQSYERGRVRCADIGVHPVAYFVYKSKAHVQFVQSVFEAADDASADDSSADAVDLRFAQLQAEMAVHAQRVCWTRDSAQRTSVLGWTCPAFEVYCYCHSADRHAVGQAARKLVAWITAHEARLFLIDGATF